MRNDKIILATILTLLSVNANAARKTRGAGVKVITPRAQTQNVNVSGTTTSISATIDDTTKATPYDTGVIAPITDKVAERNCTTMVVNSLKAYCNTGNGTNKCKNPTEIYAVMPYIKVTDDKNNTIADETYCANFLETAVNKLWNSYDSVATLNEENCNIALAKSFAAEDCYLYVMTNQSEKVLISEDNLKSRCGAEGITKQYNALTGENKTNGSIGDDKLAEYFSKVGNIGVSDLMAYPARVLDLKIDFKTSAFPRELVQLVNTIKSQGNVMCGPDRYTELYDTNMPLEIKQTSLQKSIQEKGILKGTSDWGLDQIGVFKGSDWSDGIKQNGYGKKKSNSDTTTTTESATESSGTADTTSESTPEPSAPAEPAPETTPAPAEPAPETTPAPAKPASEE
ncbi:MAG: SPOR domain-containing protein [Alphaproteobacteria bacterium]